MANKIKASNIDTNAITADSISYPLTTFSSTGIDDNATSTAITINSSQNVGIKTTTPATELDISSGAITGGTKRYITLTSLNASSSEVAYADVGATFNQNAAGNESGGMDFRCSHNGSLANRYSFGAGAGDIHTWYTGTGTERMRIDSSGNVGIGTSSPVGQLTLNKSSDLNFLQGGYGISWGATSGSSPRIIGSNADALRFFHGAGSEAMRIISGGNLLIGKTSNSFSTAGSDFPSNGKGAFVVNADECISCNRLTNDGNLIRFFQDTVEEGNISVSGSTVSYNGFTGTHWSRFIDESKPNVLRGTVLESLDQMIDWYNAEFEVSTTEKDSDGNDVVKTHTEKKPYALKANDKEGDVITYAWNTEKKDEKGNDIIEQVQATIVKQKDVKHMMSKISDTVEAKNVYGVFSAWDNDDLINNDFYVASVGSYVVRIKAGQVVAKGDLLQSNGDGTAKVQTDDAVRASTFAKVLSTTVIETYDDGSYLVPCSLMC